MQKQSKQGKQGITVNIVIDEHGMTITKGNVVLRLTNEDLRTIDKAVAKAQQEMLKRMAA
jgi:hypothetical protein